MYLFNESKNYIIIRDYWIFLNTNRLSLVFINLGFANFKHLAFSEILESI